MHRRWLYQYTCRSLMLLLLMGACLPSVRPASAAPTQRDWMIDLVETLGLSFGLPGEPQDPDYINILSGQRSFRFEAEEVYSPEEDEVSRMAFRNFGDFSGSGWLHGLNRPTPLHLRFILPLAGTYRLEAVIRRGEHSFRIGDQAFTASAGERFERVSLGKLDLAAGHQEMLVTLAPGGSLDSISLHAPALAPITPLLGWQPDAELEWPVVYTTLLQVFQLGDLLPLTGTERLIEAETLELPAEASLSVVDIPHLGLPSAGRWLRAGARAARLDVPLDLPSGGFYQPTLRILGSPVEIGINDHLVFSLAGLPYLEDHALQTVFFYPGNNRLTVGLPPGGGFDRLVLAEHSLTTNDSRRLLGLDAAEHPLNPADLEPLYRLLAAFGSSR